MTMFDELFFSICFVVILRKKIKNMYYNSTKICTEIMNLYSKFYKAFQKIARILNIQFPLLIKQFNSVSVVYGKLENMTNILTFVLIYKIKLLNIIKKLILTTAFKHYNDFKYTFFLLMPATKLLFQKTEERQMLKKLVTKIQHPRLQFHKCNHWFYIFA